MKSWVKSLPLLPDMSTSVKQHDELQYLNLIGYVLDTGESRPDSTGTDTISCLHPHYSGKGANQLREVTRKIIEDPTDRRIILSAWNPRRSVFSENKFLPRSSVAYGDAKIHRLRRYTPDGLIARHMMCQFYVHFPPSGEPTAPRRLSCLMYQSSADLGLEIPSNITSYVLFTHMIARVADTRPHELIA